MRQARARCGWAGPVCGLQEGRARNPGRASWCPSSHLHLDIRSPPCGWRLTFVAGLPAARQGRVPCHPAAARDSCTVYFRMLAAERRDPRDSPFHPIDINDPDHFEEGKEDQVQGRSIVVENLEPVASRLQCEAGGREEADQAGQPWTQPHISGSRPGAALPAPLPVTSALPGHVPLRPGSQGTSSDGCGLSGQCRTASLAPDSLTLGSPVTTLRM